MSELVTVRAANDESLVAEIDRLVGFIDRVPDVALLDVAYTSTLASGDSVLSIIASDVRELRARLVSARSRIANPAMARIRDKSGTYFRRSHLLGNGGGRLAFVYPGVVSFYPDMLRDLAITRSECREAFDELEEALAGSPDFTPSSFIFPPAPYYRHDADIFRAGAYAQALVATYSGCMAMTRMLANAGVMPDGVVGFAGGDLAAAVSSGEINAKATRSERLGVIRDIYSIVHKAVNNGGYEEVAIITLLLRHAGEERPIIASFPPDQCILAVDFSPRQKTYAVKAAFVDEAMAAFATAGIRAMKLAMDRPFNTELCASLVPAIRKFAVKWIGQKARCDVYSCATASRVAAALKVARDDLAERWAMTVRFEETIRAMYEDGYRVFLEVGPRGLMSAAVDDTLKGGGDYAAITLNSIHRSARLQVLHAFGQLMAFGAKLDISGDFVSRGAKKLDFDAVLSLELRKNTEMQLCRSFPSMTLLRSDTLPNVAAALSEPKGRGAKAAARAAIARRAQRQRQFDFGTMNPLVADAEELDSSPGISIEIAKTLKLAEMPFLGDFAIGTSQMSYTDPNLRGLELLTIPVGAELMGETAGLVIPNRNLIRVVDFECRRMVSFERGELKLFLRAERVAAASPRELAIKVQLRDDRPDSAYTWPVMEATFVFTDAAPEPRMAKVMGLSKPRSVHWSGRDIYPSRLYCGKRLRGITFVESWSEDGLDYQLEVPPRAGNVVFSRFPMWVVNPILLGIVVNGYPLWRSHERFAGAFSFPIRFRQLSFAGFIPDEGATLKCYLRLTGVTERSHISDIVVTDGNGKELISVTGWEELSERVPNEYREMILQPATGFISESLSMEMIGNPTTDVATALVTDVPYGIFERNEELWLRTLSHVVLSAVERKDFLAMTGSSARRTEWLFGRIVAKEAVRRYLKVFHQARWSDADVRIWPDDQGKPHALGDWTEHLTAKLDIAIAHTAQFVVAVAAVNARVGVDAESTSRDLSDEFTNGVFAPEEQELASQAVNPAVAIIRFWCAKEAVSKALGTGIRYSPKELRVVGFDGDTGTVTTQLTGSWLDAFKNLRGRDIKVSVKVVRGYALATCFIPAALFSKEE